MATKEQMKTLLSVACTWCGAQAGTKCFVRVGGRQQVPSTLDGETHDARWQKALGMTAPVLRAQVEYSLAASGASERPW